MGYPGGKNSGGAYQKIINQIPPHTRYIEPFAGHAAVCRHKRPSLETYLIDADEHTIEDLKNLLIQAGWFFSSYNLYATQLTLTDLTPIAGDRRQFQRLLPRVPDETPEMTSTAASKSASGSLGFTFGALDDREPSSPTVFTLHLEVNNALQWLRTFPFTGGEFVYLDPPYLDSTLKGRSRYRKQFGSEEQHEELLSLILSIPAMIAISGYGSKMYDDYLTRNGWRNLHWRAYTRGGSAVEQVWFNYPEPVELHDYRYVGENKRERTAFKRLQSRWVNRLERMPRVKRQALLSAMAQFRNS